jgi:NADH-ubiquinone oxidoreductase chain 2
MLSNILTIYIIFKTFYYLILDKGISIYNGVFQFNANTHIFSIFILLIITIIITLNAFYPRKIIYNYSKDTILDNTLYTDEIIRGKNLEQFKIKEYVLILIFVAIGAIFLMSTNDLVSIFLSIELQSYGLYLISTIYRDSELSTKAGLTYFLLGGLSSCIILLGQAILYINSGNTNMDNIYILSDITSAIIQVININNENIYYIVKYIPVIYDYYYINLSLIILSAGFMFKVSAAPFHFWSPDVYDSIPTVVTTFVAIIAKISIFIFFLDLVHFTSNMYLKSNWTNNLLISCILSLLIGSILGLIQFRIKRLYAYSTINHIGFILLALSINTLESTQAFIFYIIQYSISNLNAFIILLTIGYFVIIYYNDKKEYKNLKEKNNSPIQLITQLKGFYKVNNMLSLSLAITLLSFLGVPPLLGFFGKQMVLSAALNNGYIFITLIAVITSVISAVYYLVIIKHIFFNNTEYISITDNKEILKKLEDVKLSSHLSGCISILTLIIIIYMFTGKAWLDLLTIISLFIFNI